MTGNKLRDLLPLIRALLLRMPWKLRGSVRPFWVAGWLLLLTGGAITVMTVLQRGPLALLDSPGDILRHLTGVDDKPAVGAAGGTAGSGTAGGGGEVALSSVVGWLALLVMVAVGWLQASAISSFGDVARYLDNKPGNVGVRHDIKQIGRDILKALHESGRYDRIVVVGHSLGSIIGLDMITNYWATAHRQHGYPEAVDQRRLAEVEELGRDLDHARQAQYVEAQRALWLEQRTLGVPWLVTDFVSVGSPLSHADWLMADGSASLQDLFSRRELLHNPPQVDDQSPRPYSYRSGYTIATGQRRAIFLLHHAAAFACTRWTNIWFPTKAALLGDPFGGPVAELFGLGVIDRPVEAGPWSPRHVPVIAHTKYWDKPDPAPGTEHPGGHHITLLRAAMDLDSKQWLEAPAPRQDVPAAASGAD